MAKWPFPPNESLHPRILPGGFLTTLTCCSFSYNLFFFFRQMDTLPPELWFAKTHMLYSFTSSTGVCVKSRRKMMPEVALSLAVRQFPSEEDPLGIDPSFLSTLL